MTPKRDFISIQDLSAEEIEILFVIADKMATFLRQSHGLLAGYIMGSLFLEPSTRTRMSFEAAMNRLGGRVLTLTDPRASSIAKGESLADSVRTVGCYTDIIVLRHPCPGAARVAAEYSPVPLINAGDGGHEHPTQTLCDLYTLRQTKGKIAGLRVVLYGDLKYGRTTHSLAVALTRFGADVLCVAESALGLPSYVRETCAAVEGVSAFELELDGMETVFGPDARTGTLFCRDQGEWKGAKTGTMHLEEIDCDAIYVTRLQHERLGDGDSEVQKSLPPVDAAFLAAEGFRDAVVLHPLPRLDEIDYAIDSDPRGVYFQQAALGVPIRMALLSFLLGRENMRADPPTPREERVLAVGELPCPNPGCIVNVEADYLVRRAWVGPDSSDRCVYCDGRL